MAGTKRAGKQRLRLVPETLRTLWSGALDHVQGGGTLANALTAVSAHCTSRICSIGHDCRIGGE
jgi:hypothetical protein